MSIEHLTLADGRVLEVSVLGPARGLPLVYHHGTPGGATPPRFLEREVTGRGLRLVSFSRPGYGDSTRRPDRAVAQVVEDTTQVLQHLKADRSLVAGWSGGGPHALACAALLPGVQAALVMAGVGPHSAADLDFYAGMGTDNLQEFGAARGGESALRAYLLEAGEQLSNTDAGGITNALSSLLPAVDREALSGEFGDDTAASFKEALRHGVEGWIDDDLAFIDEWGFAMDDIAVPVHLWQGELDKSVPADHATWLGAHVPGAKLRIVPGEGHMSLVQSGIGRMLDDLLRAK
ncbi:alpha/beta fold hydrolase [Amnibacterium endophyticum]|uniref:Alpha/beta fold hydrolase n=1 Tax=Amnibacterium endophyticum TaxID=2109337 RepID=A0ABW4LHX1_9MICO